MDERKLSVVVHSLFSSWMLSFLFEGRIFYSLADAYMFDPAGMVFCGVAAVFVGLLLCGLFIKTKRMARRLFLCSCIYIHGCFHCLFLSSVFALDFGTHTGFVFSGRLCSGLGLFPEKQHTGKRTHQNSCRFADPVKFPHDTLQHSCYTYITACRAGFIYADAFRCVLTGAETSR